MPRSKLAATVLLVTLPFLITLAERTVVTSALSISDFPFPLLYLCKVSLTSVLLLAWVLYTKKSYGLEKKQKIREKLVSLLLLLPLTSYFFLFVLRQTVFITELAIVHIFNIAITVFREELMLRGIIQTELGAFWKKAIFGIPETVWITTLLFSLWHLVNLSIWSWQVVGMQMLACIPAGLVLGVVKEKTGSTLFTYLLHICGDLLFLSVYLIVSGELFFALF